MTQVPWMIPRKRWSQKSVLNDMEEALIERKRYRNSNDIGEIK